jgi:peptide/nickel transport system substrate-binding protein
MRNTDYGEVAQRNLLKFLRERLSVPFLVMVVATALLALAACGGEAPTAPTGPTATPGPVGPEPAHTFRTEVGKYGGTMTLGMAAEHSTFDPMLVSVSSDINVVDQVYEQLVEHNPDLSIQPLLAKSWDISDDLTTWTFHLREGVKFQNGKEMTAEDVVYSFNYMVEVESAGVGALSMIESVEAVGDYTAVFHLNSGTAFFLDSLALAYQYKIIPSNVDPTLFTENLFGTGPFIMTENIIGERTTFKKNQGYWWTGYPYLDELVYIYLPDPQSRLEALKSGVVDYHRYMPLPEVAEIEAHPDTRASIVASSSYILMAMDNTVPPFDNKLVRQAIQAATDREAINQAALLGKGSVGYDHPIPPFDPHFSEAAKAKHPGYDIELAKTLLGEAGYPEGIDITLYTSTNPGAPMLAMATVMKEKAAPAGINITIQVMPEAGYWSEVWRVKPFFTSYWAGRTPDAALSISVSSESDWQESNWVNDRVEELIIKARSEVDLADRQATYGELQEILIDEVPRIIPVFQLVINGMRNNVRGLESDPGAWFWARYAWLDN